MFNPERSTGRRQKHLRNSREHSEFTTMAPNTIVLNRGAQERKASDDGINRIRDLRSYYNKKNK